MRRAHLESVRDALARGRLGWLGRAALRAARLRLGRPGGPIFATLAVTWRCNYRCSFCDLPGRANGDPTVAELLERVEILARQGVLALGLTGGEPLLHPGLFDVIAAARRRGMFVHLNSNGSQPARSRVERLLAAGLHSINVSLDGASPATHDELRGVPGSFEQVAAFVAELLARRRRREPRIGLVMAVSPRNRLEVLPFARLATGWGVDAAGFLPHHELSQARAALAPAEAAQLRADLERVGAEHAVCDNSAAYRSGIAPFLAGLPTPTSCSAGRSHVAIDAAGDGYPCVPLMTLRRSGVPRERLRDARPLPSPSDREDVCRRCWWNCHRELDLSLQLLAAPA